MVRVIRKLGDLQRKILSVGAGEKMGNQMDKVIDGLYVGGFLGQFYLY